MRSPEMFCTMLTGLPPATRLCSAACGKRAVGKQPGRGTATRGCIPRCVYHRQRLGGHAFVVGWKRGTLWTAYHGSHGAITLVLATLAGDARLTRGEGRGGGRQGGAPGSRSRVCALGLSAAASAVGCGALRSRSARALIPYPNRARPSCVRGRRSGAAPRAPCRMAQGRS
eukprot:7377959-Prymnesium_polylepis.1